jgi:AraC family transcriptional activator of pyochelin receptor
MQLSNDDINTFQKIKRLIESDVFTHIALKELAVAAGFGETKLKKGFRFLFQVTIAHYHLVISMEYARSLIEDGRQVKEVAILLGYKTPGHFIRAFGKIFGRSPGEFRMHK